MDSIQSYEKCVAKDAVYKGFTNLRQFIKELYRQKEIVDVYTEVDPYLEIAEIHRRVAAANGPALFFHKVKGSSFPVVTNLFGSNKRVDIAFCNQPEKFVKEAVEFATREFPPKPTALWKKRALLKQLLKVGVNKKRKGPITEVVESVPDLESLPLLTTWPLDGGPFITLPLVYTEPVEEGPPNLGMYRIQRFDKKTTGLHFQIAKGGGFHYHQAEALKKPLPVTIFIGGPPALIMSAITPLPENVSEILIASVLQGSKIKTTKSGYNRYPLFSECEFALVGHAKPLERKMEGPFGDHYGYYSLSHSFPVFNCDALYRRKDAIYPATVVGKPYQEDFYIGNYLQKLLSPLFPVVMPGVKALWSYGETGFHSLGAAVVKERFYRESMVAAFRILGEGQLSLTKTLLLTDKPINLENFKETLTTILERFRPETDLFIFSNLSLDTLDYTGPALNVGSRAVFLGMGEKVRELPTHYEGTLRAAAFCPGCLALETDLALEKLLDHPELQKWPLLIVVDDLKKALKSTESFLWTTFTRFEPASDIYAKSKVVRHHQVYSGPILIDARMKVTYPSEVLPDQQTEKTVTKRWNEYFPYKMEMGESRTGHVC